MMKFGGTKSQGKAFVEYVDDRDAKRAIEKLDGKEFDGRKLGVQIQDIKKQFNRKDDYKNSSKFSNKFKKTYDDYEDYGDEENYYGKKRSGDKF